MSRSDKVPYVNPDTTRESVVTEALFDNLYNKYHRSIYLFLDKYVKGQQNKEDLLQEVFVKCWNHAGQIRDMDHARNWLFKVARTTAIDFLKGAAAGDRSSESLECIEDDNYVEATTMACEGLNWIYEALRQLPKGEREVVKSWLVDELTMEEIASLRDTSVKTVYNQRTRGVEKIKNWYGKEGNASVIWLLIIAGLYDETL